MPFTPNTYSIVLIVSGLVTLFLSINLFRRREVIVRWFGLMVLALAIWALNYGFELASSSLEAMLFWINIEYIGIAFLPACWFFFIVSFTGKNHYINPKSLAAVLIFPFITLLLVWTNHYHHFHYASVGVDNSGSFPLLKIIRGPWYYVHTLYFYLMLGWGVVLLIKKFRTADRVFKRQNLIILIAALVPWLANIIYFLGFRPAEHIDITPFAFIFTMILLSIGMLRFHLLDIIPIAREKVLEAMEEGLIVTDEKGRIIDLNTEIRRLLALGNVQMIGEKLEKILPDQPKLYSCIEDRIKCRMQIELSVSGSTIYLDITISPLFENTDVYSGSIILFRDVTHRVNTEKQIRLQSNQLLELNRLKDRLFSIISHDLRSPLFNLFDIIKMIDNNMMTDQEFRAFIPQLSRNVGYTSELLENLLSWSRSQLQGETLTKVNIRLTELCDRVIKPFERASAEKNLTIVNEVPDGIIVYADADMIELVVRNLVSNAVKFSKPGGAITLSAWDMNDTVRLCVEDTGVGMSADDIPKLFDLETFTTRGTNNEQGTGLGLLLCKDFVEKNGGNISVESELGVGTRFNIILPCGAK